MATVPDDAHESSSAIVVLDYADLLDASTVKIPSLLAALEQAYGPDGLGILTIAGVPELPELRRRLLPLSARFVALPEDVKAGCEDPGSSYSFGWSHGREAMAEGTPDTMKGSYYGNPLQDNRDVGEELAAQFPSYCRPNVWPHEHLPELQPAFEALGRRVVEAGLKVAALCDLYVQSKGVKLPQHRLRGVIEAGAPCCKARLLHYFAPPLLENGSSSGCSEASWCGWHTDHGSLTGLVSAMYMREGQEVANPDPAAGLYIRDRRGRPVRAGIPPGHLAFQMGQAMQVHSGGLLRATEHCVRGASGAAAAGVTRHSFAVFMQPRWDEPMEAPSGANAADVGVGQWATGMSFGQFSELTIQKHYQSAANGNAGHSVVVHLG